MHHFTSKSTDIYCLIQSFSFSRAVAIIGHSQPVSCVFLVTLMDASKKPYLKRKSYRKFRNNSCIP